MEERSDPEEEMTWEPSRIHDHDLLMYLRAGRSMAAFAAMCDGEPPEEGFEIARKDGIFANAIQLLHEANYDSGKALQVSSKLANKVFFMTVILPFVSSLCLKRLFRWRALQIRPENGATFLAMSVHVGAQRTL